MAISRVRGSTDSGSGENTLQCAIESHGLSTEEEAKDENRKGSAIESEN